MNSSSTSITLIRLCLLPASLQPPLGPGHVWVALLPHRLAPDHHLLELSGFWGDVTEPLREENLKKTCVNVSHHIIVSQGARDIVDSLVQWSIE